MENQKFYTRFELSMPKDGAGNVSPTKIAQLCDAYGLRNLLIQSSLLAYASFTNTPYPGDSRDLDTSQGVYYEQSVSFLNLIQKEYLKEAKRLSEPSDTLNEKMDENLLFSTGSAQVLLKRSAIIRVAKMLLLGTCKETGVSPDDMTVFDLFVFSCQEVKEFFRSVAIYIYNQHIPANNAMAYDSIITLPILTRCGYDVCFDFLTSPEFPTVFTTGNEDGTSVDEPNHYSSYFLNVVFKNNNSDVYLGYWYKTRLSTLPSKESKNKIYSLLDEVFGLPTTMDPISRLERSLSIDPEKINTLCNCMESAEIVIRFLLKINKKFGLVIGPLTTHLFKAIQNIKDVNKINPYVSPLIGELLGSKPIQKQTDVNETSINPESLKNPSILNRELKRCSFDIEALKGLEEEDFDIYPEEEIEKEDQEPIEEDNPDPDENVDEDADDSEDDIGDAESADQSKKRSVKVKVSKNSILLKIRDTDKSDLNTWLYLIEVANIIKAVLETPPETLKKDDRLLLDRLLHEWLFLLDVNSVDSFVRSVIHIVPKPN